MLAMTAQLVPASRNKIPFVRVRYGMLMMKYIPDSKAPLDSVLRLAAEEFLRKMEWNHVYLIQASLGDRDVFILMPKEEGGISHASAI